MSIWMHFNVFHSVRQGFSPSLKCSPHLFLPSSPPPPPKKTKTCPPPPPPSSPLPLWAKQTPKNFGALNSPLEMYPRPIKRKTHFLKKQLFSTMKKEHNWMLKYEYTVAKSKNQRRVRLLLSILFLLGS